MRVCVLGLGEVGLRTAKYILNKGLNVCGYDIIRKAFKKAKLNGLRAFSEWSRVPPSDVYIVCVSTLLDKYGKPDLSPVFDVSEKISLKSNANTLVSIESTIIPGTSRRIYQTVFKEKVKLIHVPHRYWAGDPVRHGVKQLRVIGGINQDSLDAGIEFYEKILDIPLRKTSLIEVAEMCKISENAYRYVQIAFAEELKMICDESGLDFEEIRKACNTKWNIEMLEARDGIRGHCLPKDTSYVASLSQYNTLLRSAKEVDRKYRKWLQKRPRSMKI